MCVCARRTNVCRTLCGLASCGSHHRRGHTHTHTQWVWIRLLCAWQWHQESVQLSNSTPKPDTNLFSCLLAQLSWIHSCFLCKNFSLRVLSLKLFIHVVPSCAIWCWCCHYLHGRAYTRSPNMQNFVQKIRLKNASGHFVCDSCDNVVCARHARTHTPGHVFQPFHILNLNCKFACLRKADSSSSGSKQRATI